MTRSTRLRGVVVGGVVALVLTTTTIAVTNAQQPAGRTAQARGGRGVMAGLGAVPMPGGGMLGLRAGLGQLNLTDQQKADVKELVESHRARMRGFAEQGRQAGRALREAIASGVDEATIRAKAADVAKVQAELAVAGARLRREILDVLTPEQQAKAKELRLKALDRAEKMIQRQKRRMKF